MHAETDFQDIWAGRMAEIAFSEKIDSFVNDGRQSARVYFASALSTDQHYVNLVGMSFSNGENLSGRNFSFCNLEGATFDKIRLNRADFEDAFLGGATFRNCQAVAANFRGCTLIGADFGESDLAEASFHGAILRGANFGNVRNLSVSMFVSRFRDMDVMGIDQDYGIWKRVLSSILFGRWSPLAYLEPSWARGRGIMDERLGDFEAAVKFYGQLHHALNSEGRYEEAERAIYMKQRLGLFRPSATHPISKPFYWIMSVIAWLVTGFAQSIARLLFWATSLILFGAWYYSQSEFFKVTINEGTINEGKRSLGFLEGLYFSSVTFATLGYGDISPSLQLTQTICQGKQRWFGFFINKCEFALLFPIFEALSGVVLIALLVVVVARRIIKS